MSKVSTKTYLLKDPPKNVSLSTICNLTWWEFHLPPYFRSPKELKHHPNSLSLMPTLNFHPNKHLQLRSAKSEENNSIEAKKTHATFEVNV